MTYLRGICNLKYFQSELGEGQGNFSDNQRIFIAHISYGPRHQKSQNFPLYTYLEKIIIYFAPHFLKLLATLIQNQFILKDQQV